MAIFGLLTIHNVTRVHVLPATNARYRRTEGQLARMLLLQIATFFFFVYTIFRFLFYFQNTATFLLYILSAQVYRRELVRLMYKLVRINGGNRVHPNTLAMRPIGVSVFIPPSVHD